MDTLPPHLPPRRYARYRPREVVLHDGRRATLRAIEPADAQPILEAFQRLSPRSRYLRFMQHKKELEPALVERGTNPIPGHEFAFVATVPSAAGYDIVGAARYVAAETPRSCEFAVTVADEWVGQGLASILLRSLMRRARYDGYHRIEGMVIVENAPMLSLARRLKFETAPQGDDATVLLVRRELRREAT